MWLLAKNVLFTILVPGVAGVYLPLRIAGGPIPLPAWGLRPVAGIVLLAFGTAGYSGASGSSPPSAGERRRPLTLQSDW